MAGKGVTMATEVKMPKLSDNMEEGTIIRWLKKPGDFVESGEPLAEVETDKADVELEATDSGTLGEIRVDEGESAAVGDTIAILTDGPARRDKDSDRPGQAESESADETREEMKAAESRRAPSGRSARQGKEQADAKPERASGHPSQPTGKAEQPSKLKSPRSESPVRASPLARRLAEEAGVNLSTIAGSGPGGRILKRDIESATGRVREENGRRAPGEEAEAGRPARSKPEEATGRDTEQEGQRLREPSRTRQTIARRMAQAKREIPHFYVSAEIDMSEAMQLRRSIKQSGAMPELTVTHILVKALAIALVDHPRVNASWQDGGVLFHDDINLGVAVAVEDGLVVPVLHRAQLLSLQETSERVSILTDRARRGKFSGSDLAGGTFSLSNVGMLDVDELVAVINPPQAAILAVGAVKPRPIVRQGQLGVAPTMRATLSCDHRVLNGVEAGEFLADVKRVLENPVMLLLS
jgi:pyruvate dehydrogenase E2 component (dihydrolipoamide acetyltransferase)